MQNKINETIRHEELKRVWIGDPCYVISDKLWEDVCRQVYPDKKTETGFVIEFTPEQLKEADLELPANDAPLKFIQCGTMYGDGCYSSYTGFEYGVDAGCLAVVPDYLIAPDADTSSGKFFDVKGYVNLSTNGEGYFSFYMEGSLLEEIYTGDDEDDDYDYENEEYEEDDDGEEYSLIGQNGSAFNLMGYTRRAMEKEGFSKEEINDVMEKAKSGDYNNLLVVLDSAIQKCNDRFAGKD